VAEKVEMEALSGTGFEADSAVTSDGDFFVAVICERTEA
jgi:hypothetical protein